MKETIVTIPINDLFAPKCGCPLCRMEEMLEEQYVTFITGDATNKKGFCHRHFSRMTQLGQKLPNALILETHLEVVRDELLPKKAGGKPDKKKLEAIRQTLNSCYVCDRIEADMFHLVATVFTEWAKGGEFRKTYNDQPFICLKHYQFIMTAAMGKGGVPSKHYLDSVYGDIKHFVSMFDYRNRGKDWGTSTDAIERSIEFLTGEKPAVAEKSE